MKNLFMAFRPKTLTAALVPIVVSTALAISRSHQTHQPILWWIPALALLASLAIQIGTNLVNDGVDFKKGADTDRRIGPQRVTQSGRMSFQTVMIVAAIFFLLAVGFGIPLVIHGGFPIVVIGILSIMMGYSYTAGPFPLAYLGLGDLFVVIFFGFIAVGGMGYLFEKVLYADSLVLGLQVGLLCAVLIAINNLRDVETDRLVDKKTLPVRFGKDFARYEIAFLMLAPFFMGIYWLFRENWIAGVLPLTVLPNAVDIVRTIFRTEPSSTYNQLLGRAAIVHLAFGFLFAIGILL